MSIQLYSAANCDGILQREQEGSELRRYFVSRTGKNLSAGDEVFDSDGLEIHVDSNRHHNHLVTVRPSENCKITAQNLVWKFYCTNKDT
jgi:hypothetical protein